jgi:hypothetical protein
MNTRPFLKIPQELRDLPQWVNWRLEDRGGKPTKIPINPHTGKPASSTDPKSWADFAAAVDACEKGGVDGVGFVFSSADPYTGIDLDKVRDPATGTVAPWARELILKLNSYAELSQSGTGIHAIIRARLPGTRRRKGQVEVYDQGRFFVMTGKALAGVPAAVETRQAEIDEICAEVFRESEQVSPPLSVVRNPSPLSLSDAELIEKAQKAANGEMFVRLWQGDWKGAGFSSQSEADAALLGMLRFWSGGDKARAFALFERSGLLREKWTTREDYRERTWGAVATGDTYAPPAPRPRLGGTGVTPPPPSVESLLENDEEEEAYHPFPVQLLPYPHGELVEQGAQAIGCDPSLIALPLLAATAAAIGNTRRVEVKHGWTEPAVLWCVSVAMSGDRKSPAFDAGTDGLCHIEDREHAAFLAALEEWRGSLQAWKDTGSNDPRPEEPRALRRVVRDTTVEGLAVLLSESPRGLLLARDELAAWVGGFDRYQGGKGEESAHWLEFYRAGRVSVDRKSGDPKHLHIPRAAVSICGTIQPATLERLLERKHFETGLAARLLLAHPPRTPRMWNDGEISAHLRGQVRLVFERLSALPMIPDPYGQPAPVDVPFSPEAQQRWIEFYNAHAGEMSGMEDARLLSAWSKLEGTAARLALILHLVEEPEAQAVSLPSLERGIALVEWFKHETRRVYGRLSESVDFRDCKAVVERVRSRGGKVTLRDLYRSGLLESNRERIEKALELLAARGVGKWVEVPTGNVGGRPTREFHLLTQLTHRETDGTAKTNGGFSSPTTPAKLPELTKPHDNPPKLQTDETAKPPKLTKPMTAGGSGGSVSFAECQEAQTEGGGSVSFAGFAVCQLCQEPPTTDNEEGEL